MRKHKWVSLSGGMKFKRVQTGGGEATEVARDQLGATGGFHRWVSAPVGEV